LLVFDSLFWINLGVILACHRKMLSPLWPCGCSVQRTRAHGFIIAEQGTAKHKEKSRAEKAGDEREDGR